MEQRLHARESVELAARLIKEGRVIATANVVNVCPDGLCFELLNVDLEEGEKVDVEFIKQGHPRGISCWVPSMVVVHTSPKTTGLMSIHDPKLQLLSPKHCVNLNLHHDQGASHDKSTAT